MRNLSALLILLFLSSCKLIQPKTGDTSSENEYFHGTVEYQVDVKRLKDDYKFTQEQIQARFGTKLLLTVFDDGTILRTFSNNQVEMVSVFLDLEKSELQASINGKDDIITMDATKGDLTKLSGIRDTDNPSDILGYTLDQYGFLGETKDPFSPTTTIQVAQTYLFNTGLKLDKTKYTKINSGMWNSYVSKTGSLYLQKEENYFDFTVTYTAVKIQPGVYQYDSRDGIKNKTKTN